MSDQVEIAKGLSVAVISGGAIVNLGMASTLKSRGIAPTRLYADTTEHGKLQGDVAPWGSNNLYPQDRAKMIERDTELPTLLDWKARTLQGSGLMCFEVVGHDDHGNEIHRPAANKVPEASAFLRSRNTQRWLREASVDLNWFFNTYPELILSRDRSKIVHIGHQEATDVRLQVMGTGGKIERAWLNADWLNYRDQHTKVLPVVDSRQTEDVERLRQRRDGFNYIYLSSYPTPGKKYYQMPHHEGFFLSGWYDVSQAIPEFKKFLMKNQMTIKYHIEIDTQWWENRYPGFWDKFTDAKRDEVRRNELRNFNELLTGAEKAGRTITTDMEWDPDAKQYRNSWKITPLKAEDYEGKYNEDSREASMHKLRALGIDLTIFGAGPGRDNATSGSGSDKWAAMKMYLASILPMRDVLLDPIQFIFDYNGWTDAGIVPRIVDHPFYHTATASELPKLNPNPERENK
jgi:hypothetical protein